MLVPVEVPVAAGEVAVLVELPVLVGAGRDPVSVTPYKEKVSQIPHVYKKQGTYDGGTEGLGTRDSCLETGTLACTNDAASNTVDKRLVLAQAAIVSGRATTEVGPCDAGSSAVCCGTQSQWGQSLWFMGNALGIWRGYKPEAAAVEARTARMAKEKRMVAVGKGERGMVMVMVRGNLFM